MMSIVRKTAPAPPMQRPGLWRSPQTRSDPRQSSISRRTVGRLPDFCAFEAFYGTRCGSSYRRRQWRTEPPRRRLALRRLNALSTMLSSNGETSHRLKYFFKIGAAWSSAAHGARRGSLNADRARRSRCQKAISGELAMGRGFRIKMHVRRFTRRHPWLTFTVRSFMIFSAAFGGAYGFIAGSRSEDS